MTSASDGVDGDVSSVAALLVAPGPDGVSLREAIEATNNDPGSYEIRFAAPFVIRVGSRMLLSGGNVTIEGPATLLAEQNTAQPAGLQINSSGNRLDGLTLEGFYESVELRAHNKPLPTGVTFANNTVEGLTIRGAVRGIRLHFYSAECDPCETRNTWLNTTIRNNVIEATQNGIHVTLMSVVGDLVDGLTITGNTLRIGTPEAPVTMGPPLQVDVAGNSVSTRIANVLIAGNTLDNVQAAFDGAIILGSGLQRARQSVIEDVRVLDNRIHVVRPDPQAACCWGIVVSAGSDYFAFPRSIPGSPDDNVVRRVRVEGNEVAGAIRAGVRVQAGVDGGGSRNRAEAVVVRRNILSSTILGMGILLHIGGLGEGPLASGNAINDVAIEENTITIGEGDPVPTFLSGAAGIALSGGGNAGADGSISDVLITGNTITTVHAGIRLTGGSSGANEGAVPARGNSIRCVRISGNSIHGTATPLVAVADFGTATGNSVTFTTPDVSGFRDLVRDSLVDVDDSKATGCPAQPGRARGR